MRLFEGLRPLLNFQSYILNEIFVGKYKLKT